MGSRIARTVLFSFVLAVALSATSAFAADRGPVPNDCYAFGHQLQGLNETEALAAINASATVPAFPAMRVTVDGRAWSFKPGAGVYVNAAAMLESAYNTITPPPAGSEIAPVYSLRYAYITDWVNRVADSVYRPMRNAKYLLTAGGVRVYRGYYGKRLNRNATILDMRSRVASIAASGDIVTVPAPAAYRTQRVAQTVTASQLGKIIGVDLSERRVRLYYRGVCYRSYLCAVGTAAYPTPQGTFTIVRKVKWPTWTNPGSDWAVDMPAYIGPSVSNPLGTRALYLDAPGIRIHGTTKRGSIGTAASHGCMRMLREDIEALYPLVPVGTKVHIVR